MGTVNTVNTMSTTEQQAEFEAAYAAWIQKDLVTDLDDDGLYDQLIDDGDLDLLKEPFPAWA